MTANFDDVIATRKCLVLGKDEVELLMIGAPDLSAGRSRSNPNYPALKLKISLIFP